MSGAHRNLEGKIPIVLGTIPLVSFQPPAPYTDVPQIDPQLAPTKPVSPASPAPGGAVGWNTGDVNSSMYPTMRKNFCPFFLTDFVSIDRMSTAPPTYEETTFKANIADKHDSEHTIMVGSDQFAPRYPTYAFNPTAPGNM